MGLLDRFKKEKTKTAEKSTESEIRFYRLHVKTHLYGDEEEEEVKNSIISEIRSEDPSAVVKVEYSVDADKKKAAEGSEDKTFPIDLIVSAQTKLEDSDVISCISVFVIDLYITDDDGKVVYAEEELIRD